MSFFFGYQGPPSTIISLNFSSARLIPEIIQQKLEQDLASGRVVHTTQISSYICSSLGLVPKANEGLRCIHHLSDPRGLLVNRFISKEAANLRYATLANVFICICCAGQEAIIIKNDIQDAFRNIPVAIQHRWLLGFQWASVFYKETCVPFGLVTSPFISNLFGEAFHRILISYLNWEEPEHYLADFIHNLAASLVTFSYLESYEHDYQLLTDCLGVP